MLWSLLMLASGSVIGFVVCAVLSKRIIRKHFVARLMSIRPDPLPAPPDDRIKISYMGRYGHVYGSMDRSGDVYKMRGS